MIIIPFITRIVPAPLPISPEEGIVLVYPFTPYRFRDYDRASASAGRLQAYMEQAEVYSGTRAFPLPGENAFEGAATNEDYVLLVSIYNDRHLDLVEEVLARHATRSPVHNLWHYDGYDIQFHLRVRANSDPESAAAARDLLARFFAEDGEPSIH